jgi:chromate reductase, NAD(P)H dehydrogenase (quinone)
VKIVGISGSLRAGSSNAAVLRTAAEVAPPGVTIDVWERLGELPHFNPDLDDDDPPAPVREFRQLLRDADAVIVCSPEYAHGMPGSLKNALDWLVSDGMLVGKPVLVITTAPTYGEHAHAQLTEVLKTMSWHVLPGLQLRKNEDYRGKLRASINSLAKQQSDR